MIKVEAIEQFGLERFRELRNIHRYKRDETGTIFVGDIFECDRELVEYLTGKNRLGKAVVKVIEIVPERLDKK